MQTPVERDRRFRFGLFEVDPGACKLYKRGRLIHLQEQPFQILLILLEHAGELVTREELKQVLWPNGIVVDFDESLNTAVKKLRIAVGDSAENPSFIETIPRRGYRFLAPISHVMAVDDALKNGSQTNSVTAQTPEPDAIPLAVSDVVSNSTGLNRRAPVSRRRLAASLVALVVFVIAIGGVLLRWRIHNDRSPKWDAMQIRKLPDTGIADAFSISPDGRLVAYAKRNGDMSSLRVRQIDSGGDVEVLPAARVGFFGLAFSPDGNYLYYVRSDKNDLGYRYLFVMPVLGGASHKLIKDIDSPVSFSPDGRQFLFMRGIPTKDEIQVRIANLDGSSEHLLTTMAESDTTYQVGASWSPDGRTVAIPVLHRRNRSQSVLYGISVADGERREIFSAPGTIGRPRWHRDGTSMLVPVFETSAGHAQLWTVSFPSGKRERMTNDVSDYSMSLDMTPDGKSAVAAENIWVSHIWASSPGVTQLKQITSGESPMLSVLETNSGKLLVRSKGEVWIMDANGTELASFAKLDAHHIRRCGAFVVALVFQEDGRHIVRFDGDGMHIVKLAAGNSMNPSCSPDGKFVFYQDASPPQRILRVPIEGGVPVEIAKIPGDGPTGNLDISNDGRFLEFAWDQYKPVPAMHTSVISSADGSLVKSFNVPSGVFDVRWSIDDHALQYVLTKDGVANIWEQRLSGGPPKQLTQFASGLIFDFSWSKNGKRILLARGSVTTDVVLLSHLR